MTCLLRNCNPYARGYEGVGSGNVAQQSDQFTASSINNESFYTIPPIETLLIFIEFRLSRFYCILIYCLTLFYCELIKHHDMSKLLRIQQKYTCLDVIIFFPIFFNIQDIWFSLCLSPTKQMTFNSYQQPSVNNLFN